MEENSVEQTKELLSKKDVSNTLGNVEENTVKQNEPIYESSLNEETTAQTETVFNSSTDFNFDSVVKNINKQLYKKGIPEVALTVMPDAVNDFIGEIASKMYSVKQEEITIEELLQQKQNMYNSLIAVAYYESSLGNPKNRKTNGTIDHGNDNTAGMFGVQKKSVETMHTNKTLPEDITWDLISNDPALGDYVGALNVLQVDARALNRTGTYPTPNQSIALNRSGIDGTLFDNAYDVNRSMASWSDAEKTNYTNSIEFLNLIGIGGQ